MEARVPIAARIFRSIAITFGALTIVLAAFIGYVAYSRAVVTVTLAPVSQTVSFRVTLAETPTSSTIGTKFLETTVTVTDSFSPTGSAGATDQQMGGLVTIHNTSNRPQPLVATTRLLSSGKDLYRLQEGVTVPAGGTVTGIARADGLTAPTLASNERLSIPGLSAAQQVAIYATVNQPFSAGGASPRTVAADDIVQARQAIQQKAANVAVQALLPTAGRLLTPSDIALEQTAETVSAKEGDSVRSFSVKTIFRVIGATIDRSALLKQVSDTQHGATTDPTSLTYQLGKVDLVQRIGTVTGEVHVTNDVDQSAAVFQPQNIQGLTAVEVKEALSNVAGVADASVKLSPYWQKRLPQVPSRITVNFESSER